MKRLAIVLSISLLVLLLPGGSLAQAAEIVPEYGLLSYSSNPNPIQYTDINVGIDGKLYLTDNYGSNAFIFDPLSGDYKIYGLNIELINTSDVQPDSNGRIWYTDNKDQLGVFDPNNCSLVDGLCVGKIWTFPEIPPNNDKVNIGPLVIDNIGRVWIGDIGGNVPRLYRATQIGTTEFEICRYGFGNYHTYDLKFHGGFLWFGDWVNSRILRFDPGTETLTEWPLPNNADPKYMSFDAVGGLWWSEPTLQRIGHLVFGTSDTLTYYTYSGIGRPQGIAVKSGMVWYSDNVGMIGILDPTTPSISPPTSAEPVDILVKDCVSPIYTSPISAYYLGTGKINQFNQFIPALTPDLSHPGWTIYTLPTDIKPYGIATEGNAVYAGDSGVTTPNEGKLIRFTLPQDQYNVFLPLILR